MSIFMPPSSREEIIEAEANLGKIEEKICFAYLPIKVGGKWLWFKKFIGVYEYQRHWYSWEEPVSEGIFFETVRVHEGWHYHLKRISKKLII